MTDDLKGRKRPGLLWGKQRPSRDRGLRWEREEKENNPRNDSGTPRREEAVQADLESIKRIWEMGWLPLRTHLQTLVPWGPLHRGTNILEKDLCGLDSTTPSPPILRVKGRGHTWNFPIFVMFQCIRRASPVSQHYRIHLRCRNCRRWGFDPSLGRSPGRGHGNRFLYTCLENPMDRGAWSAIVHGVAKSQTWLKQLSMWQSI